MLVILAIVASLGLVVMGRQRANRELDAGATEVSSALLFAHQTAKASGGASVTFGASASPVSYTVSDANGNTLRSGTLASTVILSAPDGLNPVVFNANGTASSGGVISLSSSATGRSANVTVAASTGGVSLQIF